MMSLTPSSPTFHSSAPLGQGEGYSAMARIVAWLHEPAKRLHGMIRDIPGLEPLRHVSLSIYDPSQDVLWAFGCRADSEGAPDVTEIDMTDVPSLVLLADSDAPRIVADLAEYGEEGRCHTRDARASGSRSCMTAPIRADGSFLGFVMFGATAPNFFTPPVRDTLQTVTEAYGILIERARSLSA